MKMIQYSIKLIVCLMMVGAAQAAPVHVTKTFGQEEGWVLNVAQELRYPPRDKSVIPGKKITQETIQQDIDKRLKERFQSAAGPSGHVLSAKQASDAGWGLISGHFDEIDHNKDGFVTLNDISNYMDGRSPLKSKALRRSASKPVQIIE